MDALDVERSRAEGEQALQALLQEWMTVFEVEHPFKERSGWCEQLFDLAVAESVVMAVAKAAPPEDARVSAQRPLPPEATAGARLVGRFDGKGVPMIKAEAVQLTAQLGTGAKRQQKQAARVGVSSTVDPTPRSPEARAALLVDPAAARARRQQEAGADDAPKPSRSVGSPAWYGRKRP